MRSSALHTLSFALLAASPFAAAQSAKGGGDLFLPPPAPAKPKSKLIKPTLDVLARYEVRDVGNLDTSHSGTVRARPGLLLSHDSGFNAFVEGEFTGAVVRDYTVGNPQITPFNPGQTPIADPQNAELNRFHLGYKKDGFGIQAGRLRLVRQNAAFIGNVIWRQNEQTFDAAEISYNKDGLAASYAYSNRAQRIFGASAPNPLKAFEGDFHFFDVEKKLEGKSSVGGYVYAIDIDNQANVGESFTAGAFYKGGGWHLEAAYQGGESNLVGGDNEYDALYGHVKYTFQAGPGKLTLATEYLQDNVKTPFSTVHKFNGFADAFIGQRIGLNKANGWNGISDVYAVYAMKGLPGDIVLKLFGHGFWDQDFDQFYGYEADAVVVKKFSKNITALGKFAYFNSDSAFPDIKQATVQLGYKF